MTTQITRDNVITADWGQEVVNVGTTLGYAQYAVMAASGVQWIEKTARKGAPLSSQKVVQHLKLSFVNVDHFFIVTTAILLAVEIVQLVRSKHLLAKMENKEYTTREKINYIRRRYLSKGTGSREYKRFARRVTPALAQKIYDSAQSPEKAEAIIEAVTESVKNKSVSHRLGIYSMMFSLVATSLVAAGLAVAGPAVLPIMIIGYLFLASRVIVDYVVIRHEVKRLCQAIDDAGGTGRVPVTEAPSMYTLAPLAEGHRYKSASSYDRRQASSRRTSA